MDIRIGIGYDVHSLADGHPFFLGGAEIDYHKGAVGHSDADVLLHAICDAMLGAANLGDIGKHFPDTAPEWKGISSLLLLKKTYSILQKKGYEIGNIDSTIVLQSPKISPYIAMMQENIAKELACDTNLISVKATTTEYLGFVGREDGVAAYAVVLIKKCKK